MTPDAWVILAVIATALGIAFSEDPTAKLRARGGKHRPRSR